MNYTIVIQWSDADQAYVVSFPEWEAAGWHGHTHSSTYEEAAANGRDMLEAC